MFSINRGLLLYISVLHICVLISEVSRLQYNPFGQPSQTEYSAVSLHYFYHLRAFSVAVSTVWNSLPDSLRDPAVESERVSAGLEKRISLPSDIRDTGTLEVSPRYTLIDIYFTTTYLLTLACTVAN